MVPHLLGDSGSKGDSESHALRSPHPPDAVHIVHFVVRHHHVDDKRDPSQIQPPRSYVSADKESDLVRLERFQIALALVRASVRVQTHAGEERGVLLYLSSFEVEESLHVVTVQLGATEYYSLAHLKLLDSSDHQLTWEAQGSEGIASWCVCGAAQTPWCQGVPGTGAFQTKQTRLS